MRALVGVDNTPTSAPPSAAAEMPAHALGWDQLAAQEPSQERTEGSPLTRGALDSQQLRLRRTPTWGAAMNSIAFMCVPRSVPACFAATGWPLGILGLLYSSVVTYDTGLLIGKVSALVPTCSSFPGLAGEAGAAWAAKRGHGHEAQDRSRRLSVLTVAILQHTTYYLTGVSELIYFEQFMGQLFTASPLCQWEWLLIVGLLSLPVLQVPSFHATRFAALVLGVLPLILNVGVFLYEVALVHPWDCRPGPTYTVWPSASKAALGFTAFAYTFGGHGLYPEQLREMAEYTWRSTEHWTLHPGPSALAARRRPSTGCATQLDWRDVI